jgi:hypothetical protein
MGVVTGDVRLFFVVFVQRDDNVDEDAGNGEFVAHGAAPPVNKERHMN